MRSILNLAIAIIFIFPGAIKSDYLNDYIEVSSLIKNGEEVCALGMAANRKEMYEAAALESGIDVNLIIILSMVESGGNEKAVSSVGAKGVMQLMPVIVKTYRVDDPFDPEQNIRAGALYLKKLIGRFGLEKGLAAYNAGPAAVAKYKGVPPYKETKYFVRRIMREYCTPRE